MPVIVVVIAVFWAAVNLAGVLMGLLIPVAFFFGGGSVPVGGAGLMAALVILFLVILLISVPAVIFSIQVLRGRSRLGLQIMLGVELGICFVSAAVFWPTFHGQEAFIPYLLLGLAPGLYISSIILLRRGEKRSGLTRLPLLTS
jgi:hypothetical protein